MLLPVLASLALLRPAVAGQVYFRADGDAYSHSPEVLPSPQITGQNEWADAFAKAKVMVDQMTLEEKKVSLTGGVDLKSGCSGTIPGIPRLNFPGMCLNDAGNGVRATDNVSGFASGIGVGASWNKYLARKRGAALGGENRRKGVNVMLGPVVGPAWTVVKGGRNWEGSSADPYLSGVLAAETVVGVQSQNVITSVKHYIGNEQELYRSLEGDVQAISSNIDDKTMHELYLWPFVDLIKAGAANVMCSYNRLNQTYACGNSKTLNGLLKTELGFQGFVVSDWGAQHAFADAPNGLDMGMPNSDPFWGANLVNAVRNGTLPESRVTDMAMRIIASWYQLKQDDPSFPAPGIGMPGNLTAPHRVVEARDPADMPVILQGAVESHVLVKNDRDTLPLKAPKVVSVFGYSANTPPSWTAAADTDGSWRFGLAPVLDLDPATSPIGARGTMFGGGGSGAITPTTHVSPRDALIARAARDGFTLHQDLGSAPPAWVDPASDACLVFGNAWAREGNDRPVLEDEATDTLVRSVADRCARTVVVLHNAGPRLPGGFADHPNVTAVLLAHLPGERAGDAAVALLWGDANPSGKLPYTVAAREADYGPLLAPQGGAPAGDNKSPQADLTQGVYTDYKYFEKEHVQPRYEFGFGLSYTRFDYSRIALQGPGGSPGEYPTGPVVSGGQGDLWEVVATVRCRLANGGGVAGAEAAQLYVRLPGTRAKQLRGFEKPYLRPGEATELSFALTRRDLSVWNTGMQKWQLQRGSYEIYIGRSSSKLPLKTFLTIQ
ncbi:Glycoside hydrolase, family 3 [Cordyceps fumosorosea ARSEF 2679]|uniref:beta-glucosidase n=1 Tax=Cordyceps fumosorosea (strain ARSEF 2679) TaxID=1081104 RepID=A0A167SW78_CORFA|nr:Glycoside hydrolase, family 3 [Cordyceps fumosorosea ARSEF 2679]OAA59990.1 Glycoside hydrolase, family 3 [Cordyceps fumosorosea ARSEF 2679]